MKLSTNAIITVLESTGFDCLKAYNCFVAINGSHSEEVELTIKAVCDQLTHINKVKAALTGATNYQHTLEVHAFNDGDNIFENIAVITIEDGKVSINFINTSYGVEGTLLTRSTIKAVKDNLDKALAFYSVGKYSAQADILDNIFEQ